MKTKKIRAIIVITVLGIALLSGCTLKTTENKVAPERDTLYQISTINSLMLGNYDGVQSVSKLKGKGDTGIGTFDALDGEMIMIDGEVYKVKASGEVEKVDNATTTPFAGVTFFEQDITKSLAHIDSFDALKLELDKLIDNRDLFYAFRIDATFEYVKTRSVPKQEKPYPVLSEVTKNQPTFEYSNIKGTLVGLWCPEYVGGINVPGYHLHFISEDRTKGGHLLEASFEEGMVMLDITDGFQMELSNIKSEGSITNLDEEISKVEK
jgi:acetolactate decarboxylase